MRLLVVLVALFSAFTSRPLLGANILIAENFDSLVNGTYHQNAAIGVFHVLQGSVDVLGPAFGPGLCVSPASGQCVDLDGDDQGGIYVDLNLTAGPYNLAYVLDGSQRLLYGTFGPAVNSSIIVTLGTFYSRTFTDIPAFSSGSYSDIINVSSPGVARLSFVSQTPGPIGTLLDTVLLSAVSSDSPTPEPATLGLAGVALCAFGFVAVRRGRPGGKQV